GKKRVYLQDDHTHNTFDKRPFHPPLHLSQTLQFSRYSLFSHESIFGIPHYLKYILPESHALQNKHLPLFLILLLDEYTSQLLLRDPLQGKSLTTLRKVQVPFLSQLLPMYDVFVDTANTSLQHVVVVWLVYFHFPNQGFAYPVPQSSEELLLFVSQDLLDIGNALQYHEFPLRPMTLWLLFDNVR